MLEITVKTLDSQNHFFTVPDESTVSQLKQIILERLDVPIERQRLIYQGKVLQDDRKLTDYGDVNGKVLHLVQRAPPSTSRPAPSVAQALANDLTATPGRQRRIAVFGTRPANFDPANATYLGAMAFPADLMDAQGMLQPPPSQGLSRSRLNVANRMLERAESAITRLENNDSTPTSEDMQSEQSTTPPGNTNTSDAGAVGGEVFRDGDAEIFIGEATGSIAQAAQAATAAAIAAAVSAVHAAGVPNVTIMRGGNTAQDMVNAASASSNAAAAAATSAIQASNILTGDDDHPDVVAVEVEVGSHTDDRVEIEVGANNVTDEQPAANNNTNTTTGAPGAGAGARSRMTPERTSAFATLLARLEAGERRFQPLLRRCHQLMVDDPSFTDTSSPNAEECQRLFNVVSETMHHLAHAYHALSDIMVDFNEDTPRTLRCRPVLIQHSAILETGFPLQVQAPINLTTRRAGAADGTPSGDLGNVAGVAGVGGAFNIEIPGLINLRVQDQNGQVVSGTVGASGSASSVDQPAAGATASGPSLAQQPAPPPATAAATTASGPSVTTRLPPTLLSAAQTSGAPGNLEFFMDFGPEGITLGSFETTIVRRHNNDNVNNNNNNIDNNDENNATSAAATATTTTATTRPITTTLTQTLGAPPRRSRDRPARGRETPGVWQNSQLQDSLFGQMTRVLSGEHPASELPGTNASSTAGPGTGLPSPRLFPSGAAFQGVRPPPELLQAIQNATVRLFRQQPGGEGAASDNTSHTAASTTTTAAPAADTGTSRTQPRDLLAGLTPPRLFPSGPALQGMTAGSYDPFLPCNSHHIRHQRRRQQQRARQAGGVAAATAASAGVGAGGAGVTVGAGSVAGGGATAAGVAASVDNATVAGNNSAGADNFRVMSIDNMDGNSLSVLLTRVNNSMLNTSPSGAGNADPAASGANFVDFLQGEMSRFLAEVGGASGAGGGVSGNNSNSGAAAGVGGAGGGRTMADLILGLTDNTYVEGDSLVNDFLMTMARQLTLRDMIELSMGRQSSIENLINHLSPSLNTFVSQRLLSGEAPTSDNIRRASERLHTEMNPYIDVMHEVRLRESIDLSSTIRIFNQSRLPEIIHLILTRSDTNMFGRLLNRCVRDYCRDLVAIIIHCCQDGRDGFNTFVQFCVRQFTRGSPESLRQLTERLSLTHVQSYLSTMNPQYEDIQQYLVYRLNTNTTSQTSPDVADEPMETEMNVAGGAPVWSPNDNIPSPSKDEDQVANTLVAMDTENLPDVLLGSEAWHNALPPDWVPIIARDTQRQRKQTAQKPFSDAYIGGMPCKRRKLIASAKPQGSLSRVISDGLRNAISTAGVSSPATERVVTDAGVSEILQEAYKEQERVVVSADLKSNPDFSSNRFPNASKYFDK